MTSLQDHERSLAKSIPQVFTHVTGVLVLVCQLFLLPEVAAQPEIEVYFDRQIITSGSDSGLMQDPLSVAVDHLDQIVFTQTGARRVGDTNVNICDDRGDCNGFGEIWDGSDDISASGVAIDSQGRIILTLHRKNQIKICNYEGVCSSFGRSSGATTMDAGRQNKMMEDPGIFSEPGDVAVDSAGQIIVADTWNHQIQICNDEGDCTAFGSRGNKPGQFYTPRGVTVDGQDRIVVADTNNHRIQICSRQGSCSTFGEEGSALGQFRFPQDVAVDSQGRIFITDEANHRVQICNDQGKCTAFGSEGSGPGQFGFIKGIAIDSQDRIIVSDRYNHRIQFFRTDGPFQINAGLNDAWYNPATDGQGFFITVYPELSVIVLAWFTYDTELPSEGAIANLGDAGHRWLLAVGSYSDNEAVLDIEIASGGIFDTNTEISRAGDGTITLTFDNCTVGTVEYDIPSISQKGTVPIKRVASDNIKLCQALDEEFNNNQ